MIEGELLERLKRNWEYAENMACFVEARIYDPESVSEWLLIACDPENLDSLACIEVREDMELKLVSLADLMNVLNAKGEPLVLDKHFRPEKAFKLWAQLKRKRRGQYGV